MAEKTPKLTKNGKVRKQKVTIADLTGSVERFGFALWPRYQGEGDGRMRVYDLCEPLGNGRPDFNQIVAEGLSAREIPIFIKGMETERKRASRLTSE